MSPFKLTSKACHKNTLVQYTVKKFAHTLEMPWYSDVIVTNAREFSLGSVAHKSKETKANVYHSNRIGESGSHLQRLENLNFKPMEDMDSMNMKGLLIYKPILEISYPGTSSPDNIPLTCRREF